MRERHADVLNAPKNEGHKHRTYTSLSDVGIYKIANTNDAYSGELRELQVGERLDGYKERRCGSLESWNSVGLGHVGPKSTAWEGLLRL